VGGRVSPGPSLPSSKQYGNLFTKGDNMKRIMLATIFMFFLLQSVALAATPGSCPQSYAKFSDEHVAVTIVCTAGDAGAIPDTAIAAGSLRYLQEGWYLDSVEVIPSAVTAPTNLFDLTFVNSLGRDMLGGVGTDLSNTAKVSLTPKRDINNNIFGGVFTDTSMTQKVANNSQAGAILTTRYHFAK
jgi:hypothetical protein